MASRSKVLRHPKERSTNILAQFGIHDIPDLDDDNVGSDGDDNDLEDELQALLSGNAPSRPTRRPKKVMNVVDVEKMASECMREISIDEDEDVSDDDELLNELETITKGTESYSDCTPESDRNPSPSQNSVVSLLLERLAMYNEAEAAAKKCNDSLKTRRYGRAIKTLQNQLQIAKSGHPVNEEEIPPIVNIPKVKTDSFPETARKAAAPLPPVLPPSKASATPSRQEQFILTQPEQLMPTRSEQFMPTQPEQCMPMQPVPTQPEQSMPSQMSTVASQLVERRNQYKKAALNAKKCGDTDTALSYVKIAKKFDAVIEAESKGQAIDLSNCPPAPPKYLVVQQPVIDQPSTSSSGAKTGPTFQNMEEAALEAANEPPDPSIFGAPPPPETILEALQQRLEKYCSTRDAAKAEGNTSKERRLQRIVKQYEDSIKAYKAGKSINFEDLPTPPGFAPIPVESLSPVPVLKATAKSPPQIEQAVTQLPKQPNLPHEMPKAAQGPSPSGKNPKIQRANTTSILDKQLQFLIERQKMFRQAALESKKNGDVQQAKEYLRMSKGFDSMIDATKNGLPIDATTIPTPPQLETDYVIIDSSEFFDSNSNQNRDDLFPTLEKELQHQIQMCDKNKEHFLSLGDVSSASKFEKLSLESKKDLVSIQHSWRNGEACPMFHYEIRLFSLVQCNTELSDQDIEITVERGINLPGKPEELDSYIKIEFPIPSDAPQRGKTHTIRNTNNPIFQEVFKFEINRKSRSQVRLFKRQPLKCEVWSKGGFFRGDTLLGTVNVKLVDLETKCSIHNSFDLMDGRKACGGKLEVKVKIRDPLLVKQIEEVREKWLVIDGYSSNISVIKP